MVTKARVLGLGLFAQYGFTMERPDDHLLLLLHEGEMVSRFSQLGATEETIQAECARHLATHHGWDGCLWQRGANGGS